MDLKLILLGVFVALAKAQNDDYVRFCYYTNWSQYRPGAEQFWPEDIDPDLCTAVFFAFAGIDENNTITTVEWNDEDLYARVNNLKNVNPSLITVLGIGGSAFGMNQTTQMLETPETRAVFINSAIPFLRIHGFNGLDLNFEFAGNEDEGSRPIDKYKFSAFVMEMKEAFELEASDTGNTQLLLTAAVSGHKETIDEAYQIDILSNYLDYILLMGYDFHGPWSNFTGLTAPLFPRDEEQDEQRYLNVDFAVSYWLFNGAPASRLVLGVPFYGRSFFLASSDTGLGAPVYRGSGYYTNIDICTGGFGNKVYNEEHMGPYGWRGNIWIGYEDYQSLSCKINYMKELELAGFFVWSIDNDDFTGGFCNDGVYPLFNNILAAIQGNSEDMCFDIENFCVNKDDGTYAHPADCTRYITCVAGEEASTIQCPACLIFDPTFQVCDYPCPDDICYDDPCDVTC